MPKRLPSKHPLAIRWVHWINLPLLAIMVWSGMAILWANDVYTVAGRPVVPTVVLESLGLDSRLALGLAWHLATMGLFALNGVAYVAVLFASGNWRNVIPGRGGVREAVAHLRRELGLTAGPAPRVKYNGAQRIAYTTALGMGGGLVLTGLAIYKPMRLSPLAAVLGGYESARFLHFWLTIGILAFVLVLVLVLQVSRTGWNGMRAMITGHELVEEAAPEAGGTA